MNIQGQLLPGGGALDRREHRRVFHSAFVIFALFSNIKSRVHPLRVIKGSVCKNQFPKDQLMLPPTASQMCSILWFSAPVATHRFSRPLPSNRFPICSPISFCLPPFTEVGRCHHSPSHWKISQLACLRGDINTSGLLAGHVTSGLC